MSAEPEAAVARPEAASGTHVTLALLRRLTRGRYTGVLAGLIIVCVYLAATEPVFLHWDNWKNIIRSESVVLILGIGMTFVVLTGGIDLSIASATVAAGMILGLVVQHGGSWALGCLASIGFGLLLGLVNGLGIGILKIPFFVFTLGTLSIYQSIALLSTNGETISLFLYPRFNEIDKIANGNVGPFPTILLIGVGTYLAGAFVLHFTAFGRSIYAVGSNIEAARLTGVKVTVVLISVYAISGLTAGLGAIVQTGRLTGAGPQVDPKSTIGMFFASARLYAAATVPGSSVQVMIPFTPRLTKVSTSDTCLLGERLASRCLTLQPSSFAARSSPCAIACWFGFERTGLDSPSWIDADLEPDACPATSRMSATARGAASSLRGIRRNFVMQLPPVRGGPTGWACDM